MAKLDLLFIRPTYTSERHEKSLNPKDTRSVLRTAPEEDTPGKKALNLKGIDSLCQRCQMDPAIPARSGGENSRKACQPLASLP